MRLGKEKRNLQHHKKLTAGKRGVEEGWMAGNWASLVAECMPYIDLWRGGPSPCQPPAGQADSAGGGVLSSWHSRHQSES